MEQNHTKFLKRVLGHSTFPTKSYLPSLSFVLLGYWRVCWSFFHFFDMMSIFHGLAVLFYFSTLCCLWPCAFVCWSALVFLFFQAWKKLHFNCLSVLTLTSYFAMPHICQVPACFHCPSVQKQTVWPTGSEQLVKWRSKRLSPCAMKKWQARYAMVIGASAPVIIT